MDREPRDRDVAGGAGTSDQCAAISLRVDITRCVRRRPTDGACTPSPVASDTSIEAAPELVKLLEGIGKEGCDISRLAVRASAWIGRAPAAAFRSERFRFRAVWVWLCGLL